MFTECDRTNDGQQRDDINAKHAALHGACEVDCNHNGHQGGCRIPDNSTPNRTPGEPEQNDSQQQAPQWPNCHSAPAFPAASHLVLRLRVSWVTMRVLAKLWLGLWQAARFDIPASGSSYENDRPCAAVEEQPDCYLELPFGARRLGDAVEQRLLQAHRQ